jgi:hypothetical protein
MASLSFLGEWSGQRREVGGATGDDPCSHVSGSHGSAAVFPGGLEGDGAPATASRTRGGVPPAASRSRGGIPRGTLDDAQRPL